MKYTTGSFLRAILAANLSSTAHKLATLILSETAWTDGYRNLKKGQAAFTLKELYETLGVSRQRLHDLLEELKTSKLNLKWYKPQRGQPRIFFFGCANRTNKTEPTTSRKSDATPYIEKTQKIISWGSNINVGKTTAKIENTPYKKIIDSAKMTSPAATVDSQIIWDAFCARNRKAEKQVVPFGYLLGFIKNWRAPARSTSGTTEPTKVSEATNLSVADRLTRCVKYEDIGSALDAIEKKSGRNGLLEAIAKTREDFGVATFKARWILAGQYASTKTGSGA